MTEVNKQTFSPQVLRPKGIIRSFTISKSAFLLIRFDSSLGDSGSLF